MNETLYDILGVPPTADQKEIRKAYLKLSLRYHPDKNTDNPEAAKVQFIRIGQAYETLSDPVRRAEYDRSQQRASSYGSHRRPQQTYHQQQQPDSYYSYDHSPEWGYNNNNNNPFFSHKQSYSRHRYEFSTAGNGNSYETYRQAFDATMAGLSEDELRDAMNAAAMIGGVLGSILGSRIMGGGNHSSNNFHNNNNNSMIQNIGSVIGGLVVSGAASALVETSHHQARERAMLDQDRRERVARGETVVPPDDSTIQPDQLWKDLLRTTADVVLQKTVAALFQGRT